MSDFKKKYLKYKLKYLNIKKLYGGTDLYGYIYEEAADDKRKRDSFESFLNAFKNRDLYTMGEILLEESQAEKNNELLFAQYEDDMTILDYAYRNYYENGYPHIVNVLLNYAQLIPKESVNKSFVIAVEFDHEDAMNKLIENGADINVAFGIAVQEGYVDAVKKLVDREDIEINAQDEDGLTVLMYAMYEEDDSDTEIIRALLKRKDIDVNVQDNRGWTALMHALYDKNDKFAKELLKHEDINVEIENENHNTALTFAIEQDYPLVIQQLLTRDVGFDLDEAIGLASDYIGMHEKDESGESTKVLKMLQRFNADSDDTVDI